MWQHWSEEMNWENLAWGKKMHTKADTFIEEKNPNIYILF